MNWSEIIQQFLYNPDEPLLFNQGFFLFIFALFLICYSFVTSKNKYRQLLIIIFSAYFYYKASGVFLLLLVGTISIDYIFSILIDKQKAVLKRKILLILAITFSLSFLLYFKYKNFFLANTSFLFGKDNYSIEALILPIGISFYTFQSISYLVDIYKLKIKRPTYSNYIMYMMFFPHLVAGPIVRAKDFIPQLNKKFKLSKSSANEAFYLITKGLIKKAFIADFIAQYSDIVFSAPEGFSGSEHVLASLCYTLQIFLDFSGYTDMAIGIALLLGYRLCLNFDSPYKAKNITDFWRRWHISLSSWLRDYVYIPIGGNKKGFLLQLLFLLTTMLIGGLWHGADWKFIFWGGAHGLLLILHKLWQKFSPKINYGRWFSYLAWILTFSCVALLWIPFRANSMEETWMIYGKIFSEQNFTVIKGIVETNPLLIVILFVGFFLAILPSIWKNKIIQSYFRLDFYMKIIVLAIVIQGVIQIKSSTVQPFIYFQF
jgi:D-alanyl-lipoteichoic acid acyltransferase DltB (MBOAT superfamily)